MSENMLTFSCSLRGVTSAEYAIDTSDVSPQHQPPFAQSPSAQYQIMKTEMQNMLTQGILDPSSSPWRAPCLLVKKKPENGIPVPPRLVCDYRRLNEVTKPDVYPLRNIETLYD